MADKTGYPEEVLDLDAQLESGLGIDSIKRVEILDCDKIKLASHALGLLLNNKCIVL